MDSPVLLQVNQEIAGVLEEIRLANADLETAKTFDEKAAIKQSIKESKEALTRLRADRTSALALAAASVPTPGKNPLLAVDASVPPLYANTQRPPLVVASLSSEAPFQT